MLNEISNLNIERDGSGNISIIDMQNKVITTEIDNSLYIIKPTDGKVFDANYIKDYIENNMEGILALYDMMYGTTNENTIYSYSYEPNEDYRYMEVCADRINDVYSLTR